MKNKLIIVWILLLSSCGGGGSSSSEGDAPKVESGDEDTEIRKEVDEKTNKTKKILVMKPNDAGDGDDELEEGEEAKQVETQVVTQLVFKNIVDEVLAPNLCTSCHIVNYTWATSRLIAGEPENSLLVNVMESGFMPMGGPKVSAADTELLKKWISQGAINE